MTLRKLGTNLSFVDHMMSELRTILLTQITSAQNEVALNYHRMRGLYFMAVVFVVTISLPTVSK